MPDAATPCVRGTFCYSIVRKSYTLPGTKKAATGIAALGEWLLATKVVLWRIGECGCPFREQIVRGSDPVRQGSFSQSRQGAQGAKNVSVPSLAPYAVIRQAIVSRQQIVCNYRGCRRECCPHTLGLKRGKKHVLTYQFGGHSNTGLPPGGQWRCMDVDEISDLIVRDGPWHTGVSHTRPQTCVDIIDVEVMDV